MTLTYPNLKLPTDFKSLNFAECKYPMNNQCDNDLHFGIAKYFFVLSLLAEVKVFSDVKWGKSLHQLKRSTLVRHQSSLRKQVVLKTFQNSFSIASTSATAPLNKDQTRECVKGESVLREVGNERQRVRRNLYVYKAWTPLLPWPQLIQRTVVPSKLL